MSRLCWLSTRWRKRKRRCLRRMKIWRSSRTICLVQNRNSRNSCWRKRIILKRQLRPWSRSSISLFLEPTIFRSRLIISLIWLMWRWKQLSSAMITVWFPTSPIRLFAKRVSTNIRISLSVAIWLMWHWVRCSLPIRTWLPVRWLICSIMPSSLIQAVPLHFIPVWMMRM